MCGIVGAVAQRNVLPILLEGLKRLAYRGYDSAGVALIDEHKIFHSRALGKVDVLIEQVKHENLQGDTGIAHTRWATHGEPSVKNAHPHLSQSGKIAIVHNGIIENFAEIKAELIEKGVHFASDTDTEVIVHLIEQHWHCQKTFIDNIRSSIARLKGAYGLAVIHQDHPQQLLVIRSGSPIVIGHGFGENFISSDTLSLLPVTNRFSYLDEGDIALIELDNVLVYGANGQEKTLKIETLDPRQDAASKGPYKHYMQKEIFEQPNVIQETLAPYMQQNGEKLTLQLEKFGPGSKALFEQVSHVRIIACGTSFHASLVAKYWIEEYAGISVDVEIASEIRYRKAVVPENCLFVTVSQSGETADTLAALRQAKTKNYLSTLAICNVANSSLVREADFSFITQAGVEMGVASTKAFTTQLTAFLLLSIALAKSQQKLSESSESQLLSTLRKAPRLIENVLLLDRDIERLAEDFVAQDHALFLGRGIEYPIALEGALKLKEISYIHAEAYPAGELKHGPLALVDHNMPIIAVAPNDALLEKLESNLQEVQARGGVLYVFIDHAVNKRLNVESRHSFVIEPVPELIAPLIFTVPLQLLAYHVAVQKGTDVDQPRNLAKSVTVE